MAGLSFTRSQMVGGAMHRDSAGSLPVPRSPRFAMDRVVELKVAGRKVVVELLDLSAGGAKLGGMPDLPVGSAGELLLGGSPCAVAGQVRWAHAGLAGFHFARSLALESLVRLIEPSCRMGRSRAHGTVQRRDDQPGESSRFVPHRDVSFGQC